MGRNEANAHLEMVRRVSAMGPDAKKAVQAYTAACRKLMAGLNGQLSEPLCGHEKPDLDPLYEDVRLTAKNLLAAAPEHITEAVRMATRYPANKSVIEPYYDIALMQFR